MERLDAFRFFKHLTLAALLLLLGTLGWKVTGSLLITSFIVLLPLAVLGILLARLEQWVLELMHAQERSVELSNDLQDSSAKIQEKNKLLAEKINEQAMLRRITLAMISTMDLDAVLRVILEVVTQNLGFDRAEFYLLNEPRDTLISRQSIGWDDLPKATPAELPLRLPRTPSPQERLVRPFLEKRSLIVAIDGYELAAIPLTAKNQAVGMLVVNNGRSGRSLKEGDLRSLMTYTHHAGIAIENARLYQTEKHFHEELARQVEIAKRKLLEAQQQLIQSERLAAMGETAATVAHEIKNPLGSIRAAAQVFAQGLPADDKRRRFLQLVMKEVDRLDHLVQSLLGYAKPLEPDPKLLNVNTVIQETLEILQPQVQENKVELKLDLAPKLPKIEADFAQVKQVLINVIQNALFFLASQSRKELHIKTAALDGLVEIAIQDSGPGIKQDVLPRIFEPFFTTRSEGAGLGLAICRRLMDAHGGKIQATCKPAGGALFTLTFPLKFPH